MESDPRKLPLIASVLKRNVIPVRMQEYTEESPIKAAQPIDTTRSMRELEESARRYLFS